MRNLLQYPVTTEEKLKLLQRLHDEELEEARVGSMVPTLLKEIMQDVRVADAAQPPKDEFGCHRIVETS